MRSLRPPRKPGIPRSAQLSSAKEAEERRNVSRFLSSRQRIISAAEQTEVAPTAATSEASYTEADFPERVFPPQAIVQEVKQVEEADSQIKQQPSLPTQQSIEQQNVSTSEKELKEEDVLSESIKTKEPVVDTEQVKSSRSFQERLLERKAEARRSRLRFWLFVGGGIFSFAFLGWLLLLSPLYRLDFAQTKITVTSGQATVDMEQAKKIVKSHAGVSLLVGTTELVSQLEAIPEVAKADLAVSLTGYLTVSLTAQPVILCEVKGNNCDALAKDASVVRVSEEVRSTLTKIVEIPPTIARAQVIKEFALIKDSLGSELAQQITELKVWAGRQYEFTLADGRVINWGVLKDRAVKAQVLRALLSEPFQRIDVANPRTPVAK